MNTAASWDFIIDQLVQTKRGIETVDVHRLYPVSRRFAGADASAAEQLGAVVGIDPQFVEFCRRVDGWDAIYSDLDVLPIRELRSSHRWERGTEILAAALEGAGGAIDLDPEASLVVGVAQDGSMVVVLDLRAHPGDGSPRVRLIAGSAIEVYSDFLTFAVECVQMNREDLAALIEDPWLGAGG